MYVMFAVCTHFLRECTYQKTVMWKKHAVECYFKAIELDKHIEQPYLHEHGKR